MRATEGIVESIGIDAAPQQIKIRCVDHALLSFIVDGRATAVWNAGRASGINQLRQGMMVVVNHARRREEDHAASITVLQLPNDQIVPVDRRI